jgi:hypothetical protein
LGATGRPRPGPGEPPARLPHGGGIERGRPAAPQQPVTSRGWGVASPQPVPRRKLAAWTDQKRGDLGEIPAMSPMPRCSTNRPFRAGIERPEAPVGQVIGGVSSKYRRDIARKIVPWSQSSAYEIEDLGGHWDRHRQMNSTLFGLASASETGNIVRSCSTLLTSALVSLMLSDCLFIPIPIGMVYSPATGYQKPEGSVTSREEAMTAAPTP